MSSEQQKKERKMLEQGARTVVMKSDPIKFGKIFFILFINLKDIKLIYKYLTSFI
jgi:hypothetical protein